MLPKISKSLTFDSNSTSNDESDLLKTCLLISGCKDFLLDDHLTTLPSTFWYCTIWVTVASFSNLCSTLFLLSMTFDRFYSIIRPHKAASFNTVKRAKVTITCVIVFSSLFNIPHLFATAQRGRRCNPIGKVSEYPYLRAYSWLTSGLNCFLPFLLLLIMNILIINALHRHSKFIGKPKMGQGQGQGQNNEQVQSRVLKVKHAERQITVTLLFVTFTFLVLMFPYGSILIYVVVYDFTKSPQSYAGYILFAGIANRAYFTNSGINFFLYVISGKKFREDLVNLFRCKSKYGRRGGGSRAVTSGREGDTGITSISSAM